jgi:hypothetical protein
MDIGGLFDTYIACAVATIVLLRIYLQLTGYPKLGGNGLHIAHVLWGGLAMTVAIGILTGFVSRRARQIGAIIGGIGFGLFIDEVGKFLTSDNDYFFRPSAVIMYGIFVLLFLLARLLRQGGRFSTQEKLASVLELLKEAAIGDLDRQEHARARLLLRDCGDAAPWSPSLHRLVRDVQAQREGMGTVAGLVAWIRSRTAAALESRWLLWLLASVYMLQAVLTFVLVMVLIVFGALLRGSLPGGEIAIEVSGAGITGWLPLAAGFVSSVGSIAGAIMLRRSRPAGLLILEVAVLVDLFLVQPFALLESQFAALAGVFIDLALLAVVRHLSHRDRAMREERRLASLEAQGPITP